MRRYFVRLADGRIKETENRNDAQELIERGAATQWWRAEDEPGVEAACADFARWIVSLDDLEGPGFEARRSVTMAQIIAKAREALNLPED